MLHKNFLARYFVPLNRMFAAPMVHDTNLHQTCLALHQNSRGDKDFIGDNILFKALPSIYDVTESCDYCLKKTPIREMFERVLDRLQNVVKYHWIKSVC